MINNIKLSVDSDKRLSEEIFIDNLIKEKQMVSLYLKSGLQLKGIIFSHEITCLILNYEGIYQLVYKQAIATIYPRPC